MLYEAYTFLTSIGEGSEKATDSRHTQERGRQTHSTTEGTYAWRSLPNISGVYTQQLNSKAGSTELR